MIMTMLSIIILMVLRITLEVVKSVLMMFLTKLDYSFNKRKQY